MGGVKCRYFVPVVAGVVVCCIWPLVWWPRKKWPISMAGKMPLRDDIPISKLSLDKAKPFPSSICTVVFVTLPAMHLRLQRLI